MKYIKLFLLVALVGVFVSCSSDDDNNTTDAVVSLSNTSLAPKENAGFFNIPIEVKGDRNGLIKVFVKATPATENPAEEDVHYLITSKEILIPANADTTFNIEVKTVDDRLINVDRGFLVSITAEGAEVENATTSIVLRDNDNSIYEQFADQWTLQCLDGYGTPMNAKVTITSATDETDRDYNKILYGTSSAIISGITCNWNFEFSYDPVTKKGTLGFVMGEKVAEYKASETETYTIKMYSSWGLDTENVTTTWKLGDDGYIPDEIVFDPSSEIIFADPIELIAFEAISEIKLVRKSK